MKALFCSVVNLIILVLICPQSDGQTLLDEFVFGDASMANELFVFNDGSRLVFENNIEFCKDYNIKHIDSTGKLSNYFIGGTRERPTAFKWYDDSLVFVSLSDMIDVPVVSSVSRHNYDLNRQQIGVIDVFFWQGGTNTYISGFVEESIVSFDNETVSLLSSDGEIYLMDQSDVSNANLIYSFKRFLTIDHFSLRSSQDGEELEINVFTDGWLYYLHQSSTDELFMDSIEIERVVSVEEHNDHLIVVTEDDIRLVSRDLRLLESVMIDAEVEYVNMFGDSLFFKLLDTEVQGEHHRVSIDIGVFDANTMAFAGDVSINDGPQVIHKVIIMDSVIHVLGTYTENNQSVVQRHTTEASGGDEAEVSDLEIVDYTIVNSSLSSSPFSPDEATALIRVRFKKSNPMPDDRVLHLASTGGFNFLCPPYYMDIIQREFASNGIMEFSYVAKTINTVQQEDSLIANFHCSLFLPHGSPMNENLDKNYLCPRVSFYNVVSTDNDVNTQMTIDAYPNPATDLLYLQIDNGPSHTADYMIYNTLGALVDTGVLSPEVHEIDIRRLSPGMYTVVIVDKGGSAFMGRQNFIKQ